MTWNAPELPPKLAATLDAFESEGIQPTAKEIVALADLRRKCDGKNDGSVPWIMGAPLDYAGVTWWPLHRLAESWWLRANELLAGNIEDQVYVYLYAHAFSAAGDRSLRMLTGTDSIRQAVRAWYNDLALHEDQVIELTNRLRELDGDTDNVPDPDAKPVIISEPRTDDGTGFVATMCKAFPGVSPEYWNTEIAAKDARSMLDVASEGGDFATSSDRSEAIGNYLKAVKWIRKAHNVQSN